MKKTLSFLFLSLATLTIYSCKEKDEVIPQISPIDISEEIVGEWVYDNPTDSLWQSMKFTESGKFYYSEDKNEWSNTLKRTDGIYFLDGMNASGATADGSLYVDMTIKQISDYSFTARHKNTSLDLTFYKVLMRTHLNFSESIIPPYSELIDKEILSFKSHDDNIATVDASTGEITAVAENGRTYVDLTTSEGTACIKVMIGQVDDGDESEISTIPSKKEPIQIGNVDVAKMIVGPLWVYDHPEEKIWEIVRFVESGKLYYSNKNEDWNFENDNTNGIYSIDQKTITGTVKLYGTIPMDFYWVVTNITDMEFSVKVYSSGSYVGRFTYAKQLGTVELSVEDTKTPNYQELVGERTIKGYKSHNPLCISVDNQTGAISAIREGHTYVDIITDSGTAVIEVVVSNSFMKFNYEDFIGVNKQTITNTFGHVYTTDGDDMIYYYRKGSVAAEGGMVKDANWNQILFRFDSTKGLVKAISLLAKKDVWFTPEQMTKYLSQHFYVYEKGTEDDFKAFTNAVNFEDATVGITWDTTNGILAYTEIPHQPTTSVLDYGGYLNKTRDEVKNAMNGFSILSETNERIGYTIGSEYLGIVRFSFKANSGIKDTVQEVVLYLNTGIDENFVKSEIEKAYTYSDGVGGSYINYYSKDMKIRVVYQISSNLIQYIFQ